jgi:hypothetical protein
MHKQIINIELEVIWSRLNGLDDLYRFGDRKDVRVDANWAKRNVIYRWIKASTGEVAVIGETDRLLTQRIDHYCSAKPESSAGSTNKKVYAENAHLLKNGDSLLLETTDAVPGFDLAIKRERRFAEGLLIAVTKPYLQ